MRSKHYYGGLLRVFIVLAMVATLVGVMVAPASADPGVTVTITPEITGAPGDITITVAGVTDTEEYLMAAPRAISVVVRSKDAADSVTKQLNETGTGTGTFTGTVTLKTATSSVVTTDAYLEVGTYHATSPSPVDRIDVTYTANKSGAPYYGRGDYDAQAPGVTTATAAVSVGNIVVTIEATDDPLGKTYAKYPTAAAGSATKGEVSGIVAVEVSVNDGAWVMVLSQTAAVTAATTYTVYSPSEGTYVIKVRARDYVGNTTAVPKSATAIIDSTKPVLSSPTAVRVDSGTDGDTSKVQDGRTVTLKITVSETGSGIPVQVKWDDSTNAITAVLESKVVTTTASAIGANDAALLLSKTDAALATLLAALKAADPDSGDYWSDGTTNAAVVGNPTGSAMVFSGVFTADPTTVGAKTVKVKATDAKGLVSTEASITVNVVSDAVKPAFVSATVSYEVGLEAKVGEDVTILAKVTDDVAGVTTDGSVGWVAISATQANAIFGAGAYTAAVDTNADSVADSAKITYDSTTTSATYGYWKETNDVAAGVAAGTYPLTLSVKDNAGNITQTTVNVLVVAEHTTYKYNLASGWNLISVPVALADPAIGNVFAGITTVDKVVTYQGGVPYVATYAAGAWNTTDLATISDGKGYLVHTTAATELVLTFATVDPMSPLPSYEVEAGWNLIGYTSRGLTLAAQDADIYLGSLVTAGGVPTWVVIYAYPGWAQDRPGSDGTLTDVVLGKGYWLYTSADGVLVP